MIEAVFEAMFEGWALAVDCVADRFGRFAAVAVFFLPWIVIALAVWLIIVVANG